MNYWDYRKKIKNIIPRMSKLSGGANDGFKLKEKGRKSNYQQFSLSENKMNKMERLLNLEEIGSFAEVSLRAQSCPMPFNVDVYDGLQCVVEGTLVITKRGKVPIENVVENDIILCYNEKYKKLEWKKCTHKKSSIKHNMIEIETEKGILKVTEDHPILTKKRGWVRADELLLSDELLSPGD